MKKLTLSLFSVMICSLCFAQQKGDIWGNITDFELDNEPLVFAQVELEGTSKNVQTNFHGNFEITDIVPGEYTLVISYLGYETLELPVVVESDRITRLQKEMRARTFVSDGNIEIVTSSDDFGNQNTSGQD